MQNQILVALEIGPKGKRVVAVAPDWPGLERGAKTAEAAVDRLLSYVPRYAPVAKLAGMDKEFALPRRRRGGRALSGRRLDRLLGHFLRFFKHRPANHASRCLAA